MALLATCGVLAVPQTSFAAEAKPGHGAAADQKAAKDHASKKQAGKKQAGNKQAGKEQAGNKQAGNKQASSKQAGTKQQDKAAKKADKLAKQTVTAAEVEPTPSASASPTPSASPSASASPGVSVASADPVFGCSEGSGMTISAHWGAAETDDHDPTTVVVQISKGITCSAVDGIGFTVQLPGGGKLWHTVSSDDTTCEANGFSNEPGDTSLVAAGLGMSAEIEDCTVTFPVLAEASGTYQLTAAQITGVTGGPTVQQTPQTLTVTTAPARVGMNISPSHIMVMETSTLHAELRLSDTNAAASVTGLGFRMDLPQGVTVGSAANATNNVGGNSNTCGGTIAGAVGADHFTISGAALSGAQASCEFTVPITSSVAGAYEFDDKKVTDETGVRSDLSGGCAEHGRAEGECTPTLYVKLKQQTIDFTAPGDASVSKGTVPVSATATSGLAVAFTSTTPLVCTVSGGTVTLVSPGSCTIAADQAGNGTWDAAEQVTHTFTVAPATPVPTGISATGGVSSITANWSAPQNTSGITGYTAYAKPGPATCSTSTATATSCVMGGTAGTTYTVTVVSNNALGDSLAAGPSNEVTPQAPAVPSTPPDTNLTLTTDQGLINTAKPGQDIVVIGTGFMPYSTATIVVYSQPLELGTVVTDAQGNFSKPVRVPPDLVVGAHSLVAAGIGPNGQPHSLKMAITVQAQSASSGSGNLAVTGAPIAAMLQLGLATVLGGGSLLFATRRDQSMTRRRKNA
ncbi:hypothetical protein [Dactylosporangium sp. CS-033363]|uniref:DUF7933 domain-containing protein n=1 Tax=Dactylosporangium sp. CS-033363 TaxID=3239935 RepID=UPI003D8A5D67